MVSQPHRIFTLLQELERAHVHYSLARVRDDAIMICAAVPGRRYEIEVFSDGHVEAEVFSGGQTMGGEEVVRELLARYSDGA